MPTFLVELLSQVKAIWGRLDAGQRLTVGAVLLATLAGLGAIVWFAGRPDYQEVFSSEDPRLLGEARSALTGAAVPFKPEGMALLVDRDQYQAARAALADSGITGVSDPEADNAFSNMMMDSVGRADALHSKNCRRAEHSVRKIAGVQDVTVVASKPKRPLYASLDDESKPRANVTITLRAGEPFRPVAVNAMEVVSAALAIPSANVSVTNARTKEIYRANPDLGNDVGVGDFLAQQEKRSRELTDRAQQLLDTVYPGQARVSVNVQLDPAYEQRREKIVPDTPVLKTERRVKGDSKDASGLPAGDPSTTATASGATGTSVAAAGNTTKNETIDKTYEATTGEMVKGKLAPDIRALSVSLLVDEALQLDDAKRKDLGALIKNAVGWEQGRDPEVALLTEKFKALPEPEVPPSFDMMALAARYGPLLAQVVGVVVVVLFLRGLLRKGGVAPVRKSAPAPTRGAPMPALEEQPPVESEETMTPEQLYRRMRRDIERAIADDPAAISRLLESWLAEQKA